MPMLAVPSHSVQASARATAPRPCSLGRRLAALSYDLLILLALLAVVGLTAQAGLHGQLIDPQGHLTVAWYRPLQAGIGATYFLLSWRYGGQTLGLRAWRVRLVRHDGGRCTWQQLLPRLVIGSAPLLALALAPRLGLREALLSLGLLWALSLLVTLFDRQRRSLADICAGTWLRRD